MSARVAFLIDRWQPTRGGAEAQLAGLAAHLEVRGFDVHAFGAHGPRDGEGAPGQFHQVRAWRPTRGARERALGAALVRAARAAGCETTIGVRHLPEVDLLWMHGGSHLATMEVAHPRGAQACAGGRHRVFAELERGLCEGGARRIVCPSELVKAELAALYPACIPRLAVAEAGVDLEAFHPRHRPRARASLGRELELEAGVPRIAFAATNPAIKGLPLLLDVLSRIGDLPWQLIVGGPARPEQWVRRAEGMGFASGRVRIRGRLDPVDLAAGVDLCVLPTIRDPFGLVIAEALASGTPVITSARAGAAGWIRDRDCGEVLPDHADPTALEGALRNWLGRIRGGLSPEPDRVRELAALRDSRSCYREIEALLLELAGR